MHTLIFPRSHWGRLPWPRNGHKPRPQTQNPPFTLGPGLSTLLSCNRGHPPSRASVRREHPGRRGPSEALAKGELEREDSQPPDSSLRERRDSFLLFFSSLCACAPSCAPFPCSFLSCAPSCASCDGRDQRPGSGLEQLARLRGVQAHTSHSSPIRPGRRLFSLSACLSTHFDFLSSLSLRFWWWSSLAAAATPVPPSKGSPTPTPSARCDGGHRQAGAGVAPRRASFRSLRKGQGWARALGSVTRFLVSRLP